MSRNLSSLQTKNNCSKFGNNEFVIDGNTKLKDDVCNESNGDKQNNNINDYMLSNYASCECSLDNVINNSIKNNGVLVKDGYGISDCNIDDDSLLRIGKYDRHYKSDLQLFPRPYLTTPLVNRGKANQNLESKLLHSQQILKHRQMQNVDLINNIYTPLVPNLRNNIQNPSHLIQEHISKYWVRGGIPSRDSAKYEDYMNRSSDSNVIKDILSKKYSWLN